MRLRKKTIAVTTAAFVIAGTTAAVAFWTTGGSGTGTTTTAAATADVDLTTSVLSGGPLVPGGSQSIQVLATNPNNAAVELGEISFAVSTSNALCGPENFSIDPAAGGSVPANATDFELSTAQLNFLDLASNQDACKSATVTLTLTAAAPVA